MHGIMRYHLNTLNQDQQADLKLSLRDWPASENDEAVVHVEIGKVPDVRGLSLKSAVHRIVLAGGVPRIERVATSGAAPSSSLSRVVEQSPSPGAALESGAIVKIQTRNP